MKALRRLSLASLGMLLPVAAVLAADLKIGFVDAAKILDNAPQAEAARNLLEREFAPRDQSLIAEQRALRQLEEELAKNSTTLNDGQRRKLEREILSLRRELKRSQEEFREDFNIRRNEELNKLQRQVYEAIVSLAKEQQFDLIVNDGAVIYASDQVDVTDEVLQRLAR